MKKLVFLVVLSVILSSACKKESFDVYIVRVSADITGPDPLWLDRHQGNAPQIIETDPWETTVTVYGDDPLHLTARYSNPNVNNKPVTVTVYDKDRNELETKSEGGSVEIIVER